MVASSSTGPSATTLDTSAATSPGGMASHPPARTVAPTPGTEPQQKLGLGGASTGANPHQGEVHAPIAGIGCHPDQAHDYGLDTLAALRRSPL